MGSAQMQRKIDSGNSYSSVDPVMCSVSSTASNGGDMLGLFKNLATAALLALVSAAATAAPASAAIVRVNFQVASTGWFNSFGSSSPYGLPAQPTISGSAVIDSSLSGSGATFLAIDWVTGTRTWTLADINLASSLSIFSGDNFVQFSLVFSQTFNFVSTFNTVSIEDGVNGIACNGCVRITSVESVPEPSNIVLIGFALVSMLGFAASRRRAAT